MFCCKRETYIMIGQLAAGVRGVFASAKASCKKVKQIHI